MDRRSFFATLVGAAVISKARIERPAPLQPLTPPASDGERAAALRFFNGEQWDPQTRAQREQQGRPCLVFNRLPLIVRGIAGDRVLTPREYEDLIIRVVQIMHDSQVVLNYRKSAECEWWRPSVGQRPV
jgi:hypothetical protein